MRIYMAGISLAWSMLPPWKAETDPKEVRHDAETSLGLDHSGISRGRGPVRGRGRCRRQEQGGRGDQTGREGRQADRPGSGRPGVQGDVYGRRPYDRRRRQVQRREYQGVLRWQEVRLTESSPATNQEKGSGRVP